MMKVLKHLTMSELVRIAVSCGGSYWLMTLHLQKLAMGVYFVGIAPVVFDVFNRWTKADEEKLKEEKAEAEAAGPEAVEARNREIELKQLKRAASFEWVMLAGLVFVEAVGAMLFAVGAVGDGHIADNLRMAEKYGLAVCLLLSVIIGAGVWIVMAERNRREAFQKYQTMLKDGE